MSTSEENTQRRLAAMAQKLGASAEGLVTAQDWDNQVVTVSLGGTPQVVKWVGGAPWPGDTVRVITSAGNTWCELVEGAPMGTVQSVASSRATVLGDDSRTYTYPYIGSVPGPGDRVGLLHSHRLVVGAYSAEPADSEYSAPPAPPTPTVRRRSFYPTWSGNWRSGSYQGTAAEISTTRTAAYGYGTQIRDTIPNGATITKAVLYLTENWDNVPGVPSSMGTHSFNERPSSLTNGSLSGAYSVPGTTLNIIGTVANALKTGSALGVGFRSGSDGWRQYGVAPISGRIYIEWRP
ncbi:hypothetical protein GCM10009748_22980 [Agromyces lapidis]